MSNVVTVEAINAMSREQFPGSTNVCVALGHNFAVARSVVSPDNIRPGGFVSGPTQFGLADCALWYASFVGIGRIEPMSLTSELSIRYLRPAVGSSISAKATVDAVSRRSVVGTVTVWCDDDTERITATAQGTYALPLPR